MLIKKIDYLVGNLFNNAYLKLPNKPIIIPHIVNDAGLWGSGFVIPLGKQYSWSKKRYLKWAQDKYDYERNINFCLGSTQIIQVDELHDCPIFVANMVGQHGIIGIDNKSPISYNALSKCLQTVDCLTDKLLLAYCRVDIIAPAFGTHRAGGDWGIIHELIQQTIVKNGVNLTVYSLTENERDDLIRKCKN